MTLLVKRVIPAALLCLWPIVSAVADVADPARSGPGVSPPRYFSAFADYKPLRDDKRGDWRALNDAARGAGMPAMPGMASLPGAGAGDAPARPGMGKAPGDPMPMPNRPVASAAVRPHAQAASSAASSSDMKAMSGMSGMPGHSDHSTSGGKP